MTVTGLIDPKVRDARAIRRAGPELLGLALLDARNTTLAWLAAFDGLALTIALDDFDPPAWLAGHAAWFQENWVARHVQRGRGSRCDPRAPRLPSIERHADAWFDPRAGTRALRWSIGRPDPEAVRDYMAATLEATLELLDKAPFGAEALHFYRLALHHEDRIGEQLAVLAQALDLGAERYPPGWAPPPGRVRREPIWMPAQRVVLGGRDDAWCPAIEDGRVEEAIPEFEIDAQPVTWAQWVEFVEDGGYDQARWWSGEGWDWVENTGRRAPRYVEQQAGGVSARRQGRLQRVPAAQVVLHVSWHEAQAWCRWAGRRLPAEAEWALAQRAAASRGFAWGDVLEWTADRAATWPEQRPAPGEDAELPAAGQRVLRGASFAASPRQHHPDARRFAAPTADEQFCGFRSCAP
jgi:gamma-glutamyl hercynylcysteine S-oxide synthase